MIEIAFDENPDLTYRAKPYPSFEIPDFKGCDMAQRVDFALDILSKYPNTPYLITKTDDFGAIGLAFFIASCLLETDLDCLVFKVKNQKEALQKYKPYVAASVGIKYALRLMGQAPQSIYKELKCLNYLGFSIKENYQNRSIVYTMGDFDAASKIETHTIFDALVQVSTLKILSLAKAKTDVVLEVFITDENEKIDPRRLIESILEKLKQRI